jgi:iron complex transport system substrate-binding protein
MKRVDSDFLRRGVLVCSLLLVASVGLAQAATVSTANGDVKTPDAPKRVVVLDEAALDTVLSVGIKPVATLASRGGTDVSHYLQDAAGKPAIVGTAREINLEAVFSQKPDLILARQDLPKEQYAKLSLIAPTVVPAGGVSSDWRTTADLYAQALNRSAELKKQYEQLDQRIAALKTRITPGQVLSVVRWNPQGPMVMSSHLFVGQLLEQLGFSSTALAADLKERPHSDILSLENLSQADGDWVFLATLNEKGEETLNEARKQPAFTRLKAVQANKVASVDGQVWSSGAGPLAAQHVLDDVERIVLK